jgi:hypothetical protein
MKQKPDMENNLEHALNSLDGVQRATPGPYFFSRLRARMAREDKEWGGVIRFISRPAFALAIICVVLSINTWIVFKDTTDSAAINQVPTTGNTDVLPEEEYNVAVTTFYNYDTP